jgi:hypothetical protein
MCPCVCLFCVVLCTYHICIIYFHVTVRCLRARASHNTVRGSTRNRGINKLKFSKSAKNSEYPSKCRGNFCLDTGDT